MQKISNPIIIISDGLPAANGGGISQTLYNLLDGFQESLYFIARPGEKPVAGPVLKAATISFRFERYRSYGNRLLKKLNPSINRANFSWLQKNVRLPQDIPSNQEACVLVSTTEPIKVFFAWLLQERFGYTVIPYFMDDWMGNLKMSWKGNNIHKVVREILQKAPCRLMISSNLNETLVKRYGLAKRPTLIIHNPSPAIPEGVDFDQQEASIRASSNDKGWQVLPLGEPALTSGRDLGGASIIYAGSIWPMHFDALQAVATAVTSLHQKKDANYQLVIYTSEGTWQHNRKALEGPGVRYGGFIPFADMQEKLATGWLLLVTASFDENYAPFTNSSVQTKLTDYMAAGKPVLYVGPEQGASGQFVHDWDCGFTIGTKNPIDVAAQLEAIRQLPEHCERKAENGLKAATGYFSKPTVQKRLYTFLQENVPAAKS